MSVKFYKHVAKETEFSKSTLQRIKRQVQENKKEASTSIAHVEE